MAVTDNAAMFITFHVNSRRHEMYIGHTRLYVCLSRYMTYNVFSGTLNPA